jgi:hypothetical protein
LLVSMLAALPGGLSSAACHAGADWMDSRVPLGGRPATPVVDVVHDVVATFAPDELPVVDALGRLGPRRAPRRLRRRRRSREPLAFGFGDVGALACAVAWIAVDQAVRDTMTESASGARTWLRRLLRGRRVVVTVPPLTHDQLARVHGEVLAVAAREGWPPERAHSLAERVVGRLALPPSPAGGPRSVDQPHDEGPCVPGG